MATTLKHRRREGKAGLFKSLPRIAADEYHILCDDEEDEHDAESRRSFCVTRRKMHHVRFGRGRFCSERPDQSESDDGSYSSSSSLELMDTDYVDALLPRAAAVTVVVWLVITCVVYAATPPENLIYLDGAERNVTFVAFIIFAVIILTSVLPYIVGFERKGRVSGVMIAGLTIQMIALLTNALLTWGPAVVYTDPVTTSRAYLTRYCEWTPLAGLMTFLSEAIDFPADRSNMSLPIATALLQLCSAGCGILCPLCPNAVLWGTVMTISCLTYAFMFVRVWQKRRRFMRETNQTSTEPRTAVEMEHRDRLLFSYQLVLACTVCWTFLVVLYFVNMAIHLLTPPDHFLRIPGLAMMVDTVFDVIAKTVYNRWIVCVHESVFDEGEQSSRRLEELRRLLSVLWGSSSDVIMISGQDRKGTVSVMLSPSYEWLIGGFTSLGSKGRVDHPCTSKNGNTLLVELQEADAVHHGGPNPTSEEATESGMPSAGTATVTITRAFLMDSELSVHADNAFSPGKHRLIPISLSDHGVVEVERLLHCIQQKADHEDSLHAQDVIRSDGSVAKCEVKVANHSHISAISAMIRDVSECHRLAEVKQRTILEAIARQKDAQTANHFTRHEIKNGLLGSIELCESLRASLQQLRLMQRSSPVEAVDQLNFTLNETLETVMIETMARDVMHEVYKPRLEKLDVVSILKKSRGCAQSSAEGSCEGSSNRFLIFSRPDPLPVLSLDSQLIKYVHRQAVSNACQYGKDGGPVTTEVSFLEASQHFVMTVTNLPGINHHQLLAEGERAQEAVFVRGHCLHSYFEPSQIASSVAWVGNGAWMMRKCAEAMNGKCFIRFSYDKTVLTFQCPTRCHGETLSKPLSSCGDLSQCRGDPSQFTVPEGTWAVAVDDSKIQRKLMSRLLVNVGVMEERQVILGETVSEMRNLVSLMIEVIRSNATSHILILMDENLDFEEDGQQVTISGSKSLQNFLSILSHVEKDRVLALVRSANDSSHDLEVYSSRSHGFFPKAPMKPDRTREMLCEIWFRRFHDKSCRLLIDQEGLKTGKKTTEALSTVGRLAAQGMKATHWPGIREALGTLKEALLREQSSPTAKLLVELIKGLEDRDVFPRDFDNIWMVIRDSVMESLDQPTLEQSGGDNRDRTN